MLTVTHNAGLFSCNSMRLFAIINYFNDNKKLPSSINSSQQYAFYKNNPSEDITSHYFKTDTKEEIEFTDSICCTKDMREGLSMLQFSNYKEIYFDQITPFIRKYFTPSDKIIKICNELIEKYNIDLENTCVLYYRGTDKSSETNVGNFDEFAEKLEEVKKANPSLKVLIQTDEIGYRNQILLKYPDSIYISETDTPNKYIHSLYFLSAIILCARAKYIVCSSSNVSSWMMFYRGNANNVYQYLNQLEIIRGKYKNSRYDISITNFWV